MGNTYNYNDVISDARYFHGRIGITGEEDREYTKWCMNSRLTSCYRATYYSNPVWLKELGGDKINVYFIKTDNENQNFKVLGVIPYDQTKYFYNLLEPIIFTNDEEIIKNYVKKEWDIACKHFGISAGNEK